MELPKIQPFDVTVRVGCSLVYEVTGKASLLLNLKLRPDRNYAVLSEALALGDNLPADEFSDSHGNCVLRVKLAPGTNCFRHDAIVSVSSQPDNHDFIGTLPQAPGDLPAALLRYTLPSRYCDSDKLTDFAWSTFGQVEHGMPRVQAISRWLHDNIEYRYMSGRSDVSAWDVLRRGYGVCRDFAHLAIALNRTFNLPTRYVTGHLPDIGFPDPDNHMDSFGADERNYSEKTSEAIDDEVRRISDRLYLRAKTILTSRRAELERIARELIQKETLDRPQIELLLIAELKQQPA